MSNLPPKCCECKLWIESVHFSCLILDVGLCIMRHIKLFNSTAKQSRETGIFETYCK